MNPTHMINSFIPNFLNHLTCHSIIGRPYTSIIGFGLVSVSGFSLLPKPPARITVFIISINLLSLYKMLPYGDRCTAQPVYMLFFRSLFVRNQQRIPRSTPVICDRVLQPEWKTVSMHSSL